MTDKIKMTCGKCGGSGFLSEYRAISGGRCFPCNGKGYYYTTERAIKEKEIRRKNQQQKQQAMREYNDKKFNSFLLNFENDNDFIKRMGGRDPRDNGILLAKDIMRYYESKGIFQYNI